MTTVYRPEFALIIYKLSFVPYPAIPVCVGAYLYRCLLIILCSTTKLRQVECHRLFSPLEAKQSTRILQATQSCGSHHVPFELGPIHSFTSPNYCRAGFPGAKTIKKNTNSTQNKSQTHRAKQYEVTSFLSTDCELSTESCSKNVYILGP